MTLCYVVKRLREDKFLDAAGANQWTKNFFDCTKYDNEEDARDDADMFGGGPYAVDVQFIEVPRNRRREALYGHNAEYDDPAEKYYNQHDDTHERPSHTKNEDLQLALSSVFDIDDSDIVALAKDVFDENDAGHYDWHDVDDLADAVFEAGYEDEANALWDAIADDRLRD